MFHIFHKLKLKHKKTKIVLIIFLFMIMVTTILCYLFLYNHKSKNQNYDDLKQESFKYLKDLGFPLGWEIDDKKMDYDAFLYESYDYAEKIQKWFSDKYQLKSYSRWQSNQNDGKIIWFDENDIPKLEADIQIIGSLGFSRQTGIATWNWSWNNNSISPELAKKIIDIKKFGEKYDKDIRQNNQGINILTENYWEANERDVSTINAISQYILGGMGGYIMPVDEYLKIYALITNIRWMDSNEKISPIDPNDSKRIIYRSYKVGNYAIDISIPHDIYADYVENRTHEFNEDYSNILDFVTYNDPIIISLASKLKDYFDPEKATESIFYMVYQNRYLDDFNYGKPEYPKYPIETLVDGAGDCEDTSFLFGALFKAYLNEYYKNESIPNNEKINVALLSYPEHIAIGVGYPIKNFGEYYDKEKIGTYYEKDGYYYIYVETTSDNFSFGELPEDLKNMNPDIYVIK